MDNNYYDPFNDDGNQNGPNQGYNPQNNNQNYNPYNNQGYNNQGNSNIQPYNNNSVFLKRVLPVILAVLLLAVGFGLGFAIKGLTLSKEELLAKWILETIDENYLYDLTEEERQAILENMGRGAFYTLDPYSGFLGYSDLSEVEDNRNGEYTGIGFYYGQDSYNDFSYISQVFGNSPASRAGLKKYDRFVSMTYYTNNEGTQYISKGSGGAVPHKVRFEKEVKVSETAHETEYVSLSEISSSITNIPVDITFDLEFKRLILDNNGSDLEYEIINVTLKKEAYSPKFAVYESVANSDIGVITLMQFDGDVVEQFASAMEEFKSGGKKKLILDLRDNPGGYIDMFADISSYLVNDSKNSNKIFVGYLENKKGVNVGNYYTDGNKYNSDMEKIVILFNENSASASEALVGAILDNDYKGIVSTMGVKSFGKGIFQSRYVNARLGYGIQLTGGHIYWPNGRCIHGVGITPDTVVSDKYFSLGTDNQLTEAINYLNA